jgi:cell division control protein 6
MAAFPVSEESAIFRNEQVLSPEYLPDLLPHRESQIKWLAQNILPVSRGRRAQNTFLYGVPGVGKTAVTRFVFREFENYANVRTVYVNCWDFRTASALLARLISGLGFMVQRRGWARDELMARLTEALDKVRQGVVVCLDEVDQLVSTDPEALYSLLRIDQYVSNPMALIFISNDPNVFMELEPRIKSSLALEAIEFKKYNLEEMRDILAERVKWAFRPGVVGEGVVLLCANHAVRKGGDVRVGLDCLLRAGRLAEHHLSAQVTVQHVRSILRKVTKAKPRILRQRVGPTEQEILKIIDERRALDSKVLYELYCQRVSHPLSIRRFRDKVNQLAKVGLVAIRRRGLSGRRRIIAKAY